ncbi:RasGEF domain-containing protein [Zychaea mexicana]|uniref:RasGEF domain-containing protein n=1 Tax=Zychaea mexicana TaxID=64656 RepID=UPI0022FEE7C2|nr:RasGEF domain-containing protein [Zychaea mexicana]KAI9490353.1 RasGEF domain-containing protein [Zychaea mexicana]
MAAATGGLPLVPLSPLAKSALLCKHAYTEANDKLSEAKQTKPSVTVATLRRLIEDTRVERRRLDTFEHQMESVQAATAFNWDPDVLARQIAAIDCQLYAKVILKKKWLCQLDKKQSKLVHLVDFHRYLTHSFAHQLIYWSELSSLASSMSSSNNNSNSNNSLSHSLGVVPPIHPKDNLITHLVKVAYLLVHVYRDMNGFAAIMRALMLPEVRRLRKLWQACSSRARDMYRELAQIMSPSKNHQAYNDLMHRKLELFHQHSSNGSTVAVPWIQPHLSEIQSITKEYTAGDHDNYRAARIGEMVLSAPGARKLSMVVAVLELCQVNATTESADLIEELSSKNTRRMSFKPIHVDGLRGTVVPPADLNGLLPGDVVAHHWLVSRVYLTKDQLISESIEVEPLQPGETLACDTGIEEEELLERDMADTDAVLGSVPSNSRRASLTLDVDRDDNGDDRNDDSDSNQGDHPVATETIPLPPVPTQEPQPQITLASPMPPPSPVQPVEPEQPTQPAQQEQQLPEVEEEQSVKPIEEDLHNVWSSTNDDVSHAEENSKQPDVMEEASGNDQHKREKSLTNQSTQSGSTQQESSASKQTKKSRLSPTAPEFVPSRKLSTSGLTAEPPSSVVVSPASSVQDVRELPAPIAEEEQEVTGNNEHDSEEEWHGYLYYDKKQDETESETWNGYPSPPLEESNNSSNSAKGGPGGARRISTSPSESSEEWKGYHASKMEAVWQREIDLQVQERDWQGYTLETLNEDELDSSTMMDGEFEKSRQARRQDDPIESFRRHQENSKNSPNNNRRAPKLRS